MGREQVPQQSQGRQFEALRVNLGNNSAFKPLQLSKKWGLDTGDKLKSAIQHRKTVKISRGTLPKVQFIPIDNNGTAKTLESDNSHTSNFTAPPTPTVREDDERLVKEVEDNMTKLTVRPLRPNKLF